MVAGRYGIGASLYFVGVPFTEQLRVQLALTPLCTTPGCVSPSARLGWPYLFLYENFLRKSLTRSALYFLRYCSRICKRFNPTLPLWDNTHFAHSHPTPRRLGRAEVLPSPPKVRPRRALTDPCRPRPGLPSNTQRLTCNPSFSPKNPPNRLLLCSRVYSVRFLQNNYVTAKQLYEKGR